MYQANEYSKYNQMVRTCAQSVVKEYFGLLNWKKDGGDTIVDVGSGTGEVTLNILMPSLPKDYGKLVVSDISEKMLEVAKKQICDPKVCFAILDISADILTKHHLNTYDHVFSSFCLHWVMEQKQAFQNIYRMLKPNGDFLIFYLTFEPIFNVYESMAKNPKWKNYMYDYKLHISPYQKCKDSESIIRTLLKEVGFYVKVCKDEWKQYVFQTFEEFKMLHKSVMVFGQRIPENLREEFVDEVIAELLQSQTKYVQIHNNNGKIIMDYKLITIVASK